jgi:hypothetical protein
MGKRWRPYCSTALGKKGRSATRPLAHAVGLSAKRRASHNLRYMPERAADSETRLTHRRRELNIVRHRRTGGAARA